MRKRAKAVVWSAVVIASLGLHAVAFGGLGHGGWGGDGGALRKRKPATVEVTVAPRREAPPEAPKPAAAPKQRVAMARPAAKAPAAPPPATAAPPPAAESPADFTGQTLTNDGPGDGWASATGNGEKMNGPVGRPGAHVTRRVVDGDPAGTAHHGPPVVGLSDLSQPAAAAGAREQAGDRLPRGRARQGPRGQGDREGARHAGRAGARAGDGLASRRPDSAPPARRTLRDSDWSPPLDNDGRPVSTFITYTCRFDVE